MDPYQSQTTAPRQSVHDVIPAHMEISSPIPPSSARTVCVAVTRRRHATNSFEARVCRLFIDVIFMVAIEFNLQGGILNNMACSVAVGVRLLCTHRSWMSCFIHGMPWVSNRGKGLLFSPETSTCAKILDLFPPFSNRRSQSTTDRFHIKIQNRKRPHKLLIGVVSFHRKRKSLIKSRQLDFVSIRVHNDS